MPTKYSIPSRHNQGQSQGTEIPLKPSWQEPQRRRLWLISDQLCSDKYVFKEKYCNLERDRWEEKQTDSNTNRDQPYSKIPSDTALQHMLWSGAHGPRGWQARSLFSLWEIRSLLTSSSTPAAPSVNSYWFPRAIHQDQFLALPSLFKKFPFTLWLIFFRLISILPSACMDINAKFFIKKKAGLSILRLHG